MDTIAHRLFIQCFSQINLFRVVVVSPAFGVDTNQKKKHGYHGLDTDWSFTDLFDYIFLILFWLMNIGLGLWIYLDLRVLTHSLSWHLVHWFYNKNQDKLLYAFASLTAWFLSHRSPLREQALDSQPAWQESVATTVATSQKHTSDKPR